MMKNNGLLQICDRLGSESFQTLRASLRYPFGSQ